VTAHKHGVAGVDWCYCTPGELEQARKDAAAIKAVREQAERWRHYEPAGFYPEASAYANAIETCGDALIDLLDEFIAPAAALGGDPDA
jgi:hypothetical protein